MKPKRNTGEENFLTQIEKQTQEVRSALQPQTIMLTQTNRLPEGSNSRLVYNRKLKAWLAPDNTNSQLEQPEVWWVNGRWMTRIEISAARLEYFPANKPECEGFVWQTPEWIRTKADELERWENTTQTFSSSPEMSVVRMTRQMDAKLKKAQQKQRFLNASFDVLRQFQKFTPEERQELRQGLIDAGLTAWYQESERLDAKLIANHPDPADRAKALAGADAAYLAALHGGNHYSIGQAQRKAWDKSQTNTRTMADLGITPDVAFKTLAEHNGNKSAAAQSLGISRAKMRRLTGESM
jgi:Bacterial regulatory protein, Fis family